MSARIYFDHNATSPARPEVIETVAHAMTVGGNSSAQHGHGRAARSLVSQAREIIGMKLGLCAQDIIFTGGGTESDNSAVYSAVSGGCKTLLISSLDHPATSTAAERFGERVEYIPALSNGLTNMDWLKNRLENWIEDDGRLFVSVPVVNSETGVIQPVEEVIELVHENGGLVHTDAVQALGKIEFMCLPDYLSVSAHKIGGPMGIGALYVAADAPYASHLTGGGQERRRRAGTINVAGIAGFGKAAKLTSNLNNIKEIRNYIEAGLKGMEPSIVIFGEECERLPNTSFFAVPDASSMTLMMALDIEGISVSRGMACSSGKTDASKALTAMGRLDDAPQGAIRLSLGYNNTMEEADRFLAAWAKIRRKELKVAS